jgi:NADPH2:quinone reductase
MAWEGRYLVIGFAAGEIPKIPLNLVLLKGCDIVGVHWGAFVTRDPAAEARNMSEIVQWCADGKLSAHVHAAYPLADTAQALKDIAARRIMGKAILKP